MAHVLIVDDHEESRDLLNALLQANGYRVTLTHDGLEALEAARREPPDVVVSDALMPRMDGFALCRAWMQDAALSAIPFIFYSASYPEPEDARLALALGALRYLIKPLEAEVFLAELRAALAQGSVRPTPAAALEDSTFYALHDATLARKLEAKIRQLESANRELRVSEARLRDSEQRYRSIVETSFDGFWIVDTEGRVLEVNDAYCHLTGYAREELLRMRINDLDATETAAATAARIRDVIEKGQAQFEVRHRHKNGQLVDLGISATFRADLYGGCFFVFLRDITQRKRAEEALWESEARFRSLTEMSSDFYWQTDAEHRLTQRISGSNPSASSVRRQPLQLGERRWETPSLSPDADGWQAHRATLDAHQPFRNFEFSRIGTDGAEHVVSISGEPVFDAAGVFAGYRGVGTDISERKRSEQELRARELRYRAVAASAHDAFVTGDAAGRIAAWNPGAARIFGYAEDEIIGQALTLLIPQRFRERHLEGMKRAQSSGERRIIGKTVELVGRRKDGSEFPLELSLAEWAVAEGKFFTGIIRDITARKRMETELRAAEEQFRGLVEQSIAGIYIIQDGKFAYVNPRFAEIRGFGSAEELIGRDPAPLIAEKDRATVAENNRRLLAGEAQSISYSFTALRKDGSAVEVGLHGTCATYLGRPAVIGLLQDISEKKRAEEEIQRYLHQLEAALLSTVELATTLSELRDPYRAGHERRVAQIAVAIGTELGFDPQRIEGLRVSGYLHDIGTIAIPAEILSKPGKLSPIEFQLIQGHAQASYDALKTVQFPWPVAEIALQHHERMDGSGYPQGLKGEAILIEARILAVADVVEAMSAHRPYRAGLGIDKALAEIERGRGSAYDPLVVDACLRLFREQAYLLPD